MTRTVRIAAAQYPLEELASFAAFEAKLARWVREAAGDGAQLLVFPEYASLELTALAGREVSRDLKASLEAMQSYLGAYDTAYAALAKEHGVYILGGSAPVKLADGGFVNRARLFAPSGAGADQQKIVMTRFEAEEWGIGQAPGLPSSTRPWASSGSRSATTPNFRLSQGRSPRPGPRILLAPSCTETLAGYHRVKAGCAARALENQIFTIQSPTVGEAPWSAAADMNIGAAGIFAPPDSQFSADGVIELGPMSAPQWVFADLDLEGLARVRRDGDVLNSRDWHLQPGAAPLPRAKTVALE